MSESTYELVEILYQFVNTHAFEESKHFLEERAELLDLDVRRLDGAWLILQVAEKEAGASEEALQRIRLFHVLLDRCREVGIEQAFTEIAEQLAGHGESNAHTLNSDSIRGIISNTVSVMTRAQNNRLEWREDVAKALQDAQQRGADWQFEVDFFTAILDILNGQRPELSPNHPYAYAVTAIIEHITELEKGYQDAIHVIAEGKPYIAGRTSWEETMRYSWAPESVEKLLLFFRNPKHHEQQAVKSGKSEYALVIEQGIIFFLFRFLGANPGQNGIDWSDTPFTWHMLPEELRVLPPSPEELRAQARLLLQTMLINADTGIVLAIRVETLSHEFTTQLYQAIRTQAYTPFDEVVYDEYLKEIYEKYPHSKALLSRAMVRCEGGS